MASRISLTTKTRYLIPYPIFKFLLEYEYPKFKIINIHPCLEAMLVDDRSYNSKVRQ